MPATLADDGGYGRFPNTPSSHLSLKGTCVPLGSSLCVGPVASEEDERDPRRAWAANLMARAPKSAHFLLDQKQTIPFKLNLKKNEKTLYILNVLLLLLPP